MNILNKKLPILGVLLIISIIIMRFFDASLKNGVCTQGIVSFELAKDFKTTQKIINSWDTNARQFANYSLLFDFVFILIYTLFIAALIYKINTILWKNSPFFNLGKLIILFVFLAGLFDVIENTALLNLLNGSTNTIYSSLAFYFASTKFLLLLISISYLILNGIYYFLKKYNKL